MEINKYASIEVKKKLIGVVGGVGPEASNKFCEFLISKKKGTCDQDKIPFVHLCNPQIPDRTDYILGLGKDPTPELIKTSKILENLGVDLIIVPCNTAHVFLPKVQEEIKVPIVDMEKILVKKILLDKNHLKKIGLLTTDGALKSKIFQSYFNEVGIETILPDKYEQENLVMKSIYGKEGIKSGKKLIPKRLLTQAIKSLIERGAEAIVLGCTELPLVIKQKDFSIKVFDPMELTAREIVNYVESSENEVIVTMKYEIREFAEKMFTEIDTEKMFTKVDLEAELK
ncbi:amino acid racemase [Patescibacteria group bacterium]|nr:amino acid racemase [Patescibacteria group bacterium]